MVNQKSANWRSGGVTVWRRSNSERKTCRRDYCPTGRWFSGLGQGVMTQLRHVHKEVIYVLTDILCVGWQLCNPVWSGQLLHLSFERKLESVRLLSAGIFVGEKGNIVFTQLAFNNRWHECFQWVKCINFRNLQKGLKSSMYCQCPILCLCLWNALYATFWAAVKTNQWTPARSKQSVQDLAGEAVSVCFQTNRDAVRLMGESDRIVDPTSSAIGTFIHVTGFRKHRHYVN